MRIELWYPPITDPTAGYHSIAYLVGHIQAHGFAETVVRDVNIDAFQFTVDNAEPILAAAHERMKYLGGQPHPSADEADEMLELQALHVVSVDKLRHAVAVLRGEREGFYDYYGGYLPAAQQVIAWMRIVGTAGFPGQFGDSGFSLSWNVAGASWWNSRIACDPGIRQRLNAPFERYYKEHLLPTVRERAPDVIGISATYQVQIPFATHLAHAVRRGDIRTSSGAPPVLLAGGTAVTFLRRNLRPDHWRPSPETADKVDETKLREMFNDFDALVIGEGETPFLRILESLRETGTIPTAPGILALGRSQVFSQPLSLQWESMETRPAKATFTVPSYDIMSAPYLSPIRFRYYTPTRGCYWDKCEFCVYGNRAPGRATAPWRQEGVEHTLDNLQQLTMPGDFIYLSVDVLAPAAMTRFAQGVRDRGLGIYWGAEVRLESYWDQEKCDLLYEGGCRGLSVGLEAGSQRVLDRMNKGIRLDDAVRTMRYLRKAGICVQPMTFFAFPNETVAEAMETFRLLDEHRDLWTQTLSAGWFELEHDSGVARDASRFGIVDMRMPSGDDISAHFDFDLVSDDVPRARPGDSWLRRLGGRLDQLRLGRPWLGIDTAHSLAYAQRFGPDVVNVIPRTAVDLCANNQNWELNGVVVGATEEQCVRFRGNPCTAFIRYDGKIFPLPGTRYARLIALVRPPENTVAHPPIRAAANRRDLMWALSNRILVPQTKPSGSEAGAANDDDRPDHGAPRRTRPVGNKTADGGTGE